MLSSRRIVITGASGALGQSVVERARAEGATVVALDLHRREGCQAHEFHEVDLTRSEAVEEVIGRLETFDVLFNLAGGFAMGSSAWSADDGDWERMMQLNVTTLRTVLKAAVPRLLERDRGAIVNVGALGALSGAAEMSAYCAAKSVVMRLTESLSEELRHRGIQVNAVLPSVIDTPANRAGMPDADPSKWVSPRDLASVICFLGSANAAAIHGALIPVRGLS